MNENFDDRSRKEGDENLKSENEFLKMKLMLEHGAEFGEIKMESEVTANIENEFLNYIAEYEKTGSRKKNNKSI
jgi:hypothetical protein